MRLIQGDCLEEMAKLPESSVDLVLTDPPYGIDYQSSWRTDSRLRHKKISNDKNPFVWWIYSAAKVMKDGAAMLCFCRWDVAEAFRLCISWAGLCVKSQVVWDRMSHGMGDLNGSPAPQHDLIWFAVKGRYTFHGRRPKSVVQSMRLSGSDLVHPNEKPVDLMESILESYSRPGAVVLDCFMGSGTTGVACMNTGRKFIGIELDEGYFQTAEQRIKRAKEEAVTLWSEVEA